MLVPIFGTISSGGSSWLKIFNRLGPNSLKRWRMRQMVLAVPAYVRKRQPCLMVSIAALLMGRRKMVARMIVDRS